MLYWLNNAWKKIIFSLPFLTFAMFLIARAIIFAGEVEVGTGHRRLCTLTPHGTRGDCQGEVTL